MNTQTLFRQPLLWWAVVVMLALLSFYVHLLNDQVERGAQRRETVRNGEQRLASVAPPPRASARRR